MPKREQDKRNQQERTYLHLHVRLADKLLDAIGVSKLKEQLVERRYIAQQLILYDIQFRTGHSPPSLRNRLQAIPDFFCASLFQAVPK